MNHYVIVPCNHDFNQPIAVCKDVEQAVMIARQCAADDTTGSDFVVFEVPRYAQSSISHATNRDVKVAYSVNTYKVTADNRGITLSNTIIRLDHLGQKFKINGHTVVSILKVGVEAVEVYCEEGEWYAVLHQDGQVLVKRPSGIWLPAPSVDMTTVELL